MKFCRVSYACRKNVRVSRFTFAILRRVLYSEVDYLPTGWIIGQTDHTYAFIKEASPQMKPSTKKLLKSHSCCCVFRCANRWVVWNFNNTKIFCFLIDYMWLLPQKHVLAPKIGIFFLSKKICSYTWWWWRKSPIKVSSLFGHLKMSENFEGSVKIPEIWNLKKWVLPCQIPAYECIIIIIQVTLRITDSQY